MTTDRDCKKENNDCGKQSNNQYSVNNVEKSLEMEIEREEDILLGI